MIQEYLFTVDEHKAELESFAVSEKIHKEISTIENSPCWTLCLSIDSESKEAAKLLDSLNSQICDQFNPTVLSNGCSAYFNKSLYPIVNEFERKLRKLLYLASALQGDDDVHKVIIDLESKDLGKIFVALFSDSGFVKCVKEKINQKTWQFTRAELLTAIEELEEKPLWDTLLGCECVKTLREQFGELRKYRNDVMHAHNINQEEFRTAKGLFEKVNEELGVAIGKLIGAKEENEAIIPADFNGTLGAALSAMQNQVDTSSLISAFEMLKETIPVQPVIVSELTKTLSDIGKTVKGEYTLKPEFKDAIANLGKIAALQRDISPSINALNEIAKRMEAYKIEIPPAITDLQHRLSEIKFGSLLGRDDSVDKDEEDKPK